MSAELTRICAERELPKWVQGRLLSGRPLGRTVLPSEDAWEDQSVANIPSGPVCTVVVVGD